MTTTEPVTPIEAVPAFAPAAAPATSSVSPTRRQLWRRSRWFLLSAVVLLLAGLLIAGLGGNSQYPPLDPRSPDRDGTRAVVHLLEKRGLTTRTVATEAELTAALREPGTTVVLPEPDLLTTPQLDSLSDVRRGSDSRLVLISPEAAALDAFAPGITLATVSAGLPDSVGSLSGPADCPLPEAVRAGRAELGGLLYRPGPDDIACYPRHGRYPLVRHTDAGSRELVVLGSGRLLTNDRLDDDGNASLALGLLGSRQHLVWYLPDYSGSAPATERKALTDYIPSGWSWALLQLGIATLLAAFWRGRRLGPVVSENLPVVVRAAETTEGRARLYQRAKARGHAADSLRRAARHRLAPVLGVPLSAGEPDPTALCAAVADRLDRPSADVRSLLYGTPPTDDAALLRLTDDLDALERQVRQP
ncbi:DUF4350 domain-containing protein [Kitasatospora atroaurantiaca]|uniref:Uncharacterized protein DUF4350 n=1 Tax=Kitasatospora atroaurantiaca TaxID=285545 RepID=A0A561EPR1_9ACTN|nr:DUF4350 domain-containing protein [Kitasatospora atroaurantiaca]TWE17605.1 uncharacterized protein DUF4350 [Kitasatospora atroaurantiaca]